MPFTLNINDSEKTVTVISSVAITFDDPTWISADNAIDAVHDSATLGTVVYGAMTTTITTKDGRVFVATWNINELAAIHSAIAAVNLAVMSFGIGSISVSYP